LFLVLGLRLLVSGFWPEATGGWLPVSCFLFSANGLWLLVAGCRVRP